MKLYRWLWSNYILLDQTRYIMQSSTGDYYFTNLSESMGSTKVILTSTNRKLSPSDNYVVQEICEIEKSLYGIYYCSISHIQEYMKSDTELLKREFPNFFREY